MKKTLLSIFTLCSLGMFQAAAEPADNTPEWQSQYAIGLNKLEPHAYVWPFENEKAVSALVSKPERQMEIPLDKEPRQPSEGFLQTFFLYRRMGRHQRPRQLGTPGIRHGYLCK